ncbi:GMC family oxidoreductase N-terminal domain-containing protein, partial [Vibrio parahaemolyticus]
MRRNASGCVGSGVCVFGCPVRAKQDTGLTYVPRARAAGARLLTGA